MLRLDNLLTRYFFIQGYHYVKNPNIFHSCLTGFKILSAKFRMQLLKQGKNHGLRTPREEITFTARPKIHSHSQIYRYGRSIFCLPQRPKFSDIFDLCLHWVSVVRVVYHTPRLDILTTLVSCLTIVRHSSGGSYLEIFRHTSGSRRSGSGQVGQTAMR